MKKKNYTKAYLFHYFMTNKSKFNVFKASYFILLMDSHFVLILILLTFPWEIALFNNYFLPVYQK